MTIKVQEHQKEALALLRKHLGNDLSVGPAPATASAPPSASRAPQSMTPEGRQPAERPAVLPPLSASEDLARNRPGAKLLGLIAERGPSTAQRLRAKLLRQSSEWDSWYTGLGGEQKVGRELERLSSLGWRTLHGIEKSNGGDIDHLLIGPGGVFNINTKTHKGATVWVGDAMTKVNGGQPHPYGAASKAESDYVRRVLRRYCAFDVPVAPVLVFVGVASLHRAATQNGIRVYQEREVSALGPLTGKLTSEQVEAVYAAARHRGAWLRT
ncbi:nuclease-related domain-containing protein [Streptomyces sp. NPDC093600]|uniref:nuclease-related domain-containing protein n=1 Tax=Streptomyces sp. NPDC093600 TaxID=3366047 RepID=UPI0037FF6973